jgi:ring-1,2-phenylacetyl-CoA epoxidase subunit PaaC
VSAGVVSAGAASARVVATNPALREMEPRLEDAYVQLLLFLADSELVIGHRHSEWTGFAPSAEADVAFSSIAQDEMGHAHLYYSLVAGAESESAVDALALDRGPRQLRHLPLLHAANGDWFFTIARHLYWDVFEGVFLAAAIQTSLPLLAGAAARVGNEEIYHEEHAVQWLALLSSRPPQHHRMVAQLGRVTASAGNPALSAAGLDALGTAGAMVGQEELARAYSTALKERLLAAGWTTAEAAVALGPLAGRGDGATPPGLYRLHRDLTGLRRAHAGASW